MVTLSGGLHPAKRLVVLERNDGRTFRLKNRRRGSETSFFFFFFSNISFLVVLYFKVQSYHPSQRLLHKKGRWTSLLEAPV